MFLLAYHPTISFVEIQRQLVMKASMATYECSHVIVTKCMHTIRYMCL